MIIDVYNNCNIYFRSAFCLNAKPWQSESKDITVLYFYDYAIERTNACNKYINLIVPYTQHTQSAPKQ